MKRFLVFLGCVMFLLFSCGRDEEPQQEKKKEDPQVGDWENTTIDGDASMSSAMLFNVCDSLHVVKDVTNRATTTVAGVTTFSENDIVTISAESDFRDSDTKNYIVASDGTSLNFAGTPATNEFHWESAAETVKLRAWSYGKGMASSQYNTAQVCPDGAAYNLPTDQSGGYGELLYCAKEISWTVAKAQGGIDLDMQHQLARIIVKLKRKATDDTSAIQSVTIGDGTASIPTSATFVMPTSFSQQTGNWEDISKTATKIKCHTDAPTTDDTAAGIEAVYSAVVIPDTYASGINLVQVTMSDGNKYNYTTTSATPLSAGNQYVFTISIGNDVASLNATYPTEWTSAGYPITSYNSGESFGVYVRNSEGTMLYSNVEMPAATSGSTVSLNVGSLSRKLSTSYTYFIYYPYRSNPGTVTTTAATAEAFFAGVISGWTTAASQNTTGALRANDLQVAMIAGDGTKTHAMTASMAHKAGLAVMTLGTKSVPTVQYHNSSGTLLSGTTDGTTTSVTASGTFSTNIPYVNSTKCYAIIREAGRTFTGTGADVWKTSYTTPTVTPGTVYTFSAESKRTFIRKGWQYECIGSVETFTAPVAGNYKLEVWGAGAGQDYDYNKGGYAYGDITRSASSKLYVCVGGFGGYNFDDWYKDIGITGYSNTVRAYNGGGGINASGAALYSANPGGGATHIATTTNRGVLKNYKSYQSEVLLVAGGSGANEWPMNDGSPTGGTGGGTNGGNGRKITYSVGCNYFGTGGSQSGGGTTIDGVTGSTSVTVTAADFGQGGIGATSGDHGAGGGGGWYGGGGTAYAGAAGGGSGHIGSGFISGTTGMQNGVKTGHGQARITSLFEWSF